MPPFIEQTFDASERWHFDSGFSALLSEQRSNCQDFTCNKYGGSVPMCQVPKTNLILRQNVIFQGDAAFERLSGLDARPA